MPSSESILDGLTAIARSAWPFAVAWHVAIGLALLALVRGWRPTQRNAALLLCAPLISVSVFAAIHANPFNAIVFAVGAMALLALATRLPREPVHRAPTAFAVAGALLLAFGWLYPHFLEDRSPIVYLYAAPTGLVPCPTLSAVIGIALVADGFRSRAWSTTLAAMGLFYGVFGALKLGVMIDITLTAGALVLLAASWSSHRRD